MPPIFPQISLNNWGFFQSHELKIQELFMYLGLDKRLQVQHGMKAWTEYVFNDHTYMHACMHVYIHAKIIIQNVTLQYIPVLVGLMPAPFPTVGRALS